jgi:hypothetical protein
VENKAHHMETKKTCLAYLERPEVAELVSSKLAGGLETRLFRAFLQDVPGRASDPQGEQNAQDPFETLDRENDLLEAAREGYLGAVEWLHARMMADPKEGDARVFARVCAEAASGGRLDVLMWARENGCPWNVSTCIEAAENGHLACLKWAHENGCPLENGRPLKNNICLYAAEGGHLECLKWARWNGCPWDERTCNRAAYRGHLECLKWAHENGCPLSERTCAHAAEGGRLDCLKWARESGCDWDKWTCTKAAEGGSLECLEWARENGCDWDEWTCAHAAGNGRLECLKWARKNGCPWDKRTCAFAINTAERLGSVREKDGGWYDEWISAYAAKKDRVTECLEWARANGCPE